MPMGCSRHRLQLSAYLDNELGGEDMLAVRSHLRECPACAAELEEVKSARRLMARLSAPPVPAELDARLASAVFGRPERARPVLPLWSTGLIAAAAAACAFWFMQATSTERAAGTVFAGSDPSPAITASHDAAFAEGGDPFGVYAPGLTVSSR